MMTHPTVQVATIEQEDKRRRRIRRRIRSRVICLRSSVLPYIIALYICYCGTLEERFSCTSCRGCAVVLSPIPVVCAQETNDEGRKGADRRTNVATTATRSKNPQPVGEKEGGLNQILIRAGKRGLGGGIPGALAGIVQVVTLMWLRTIINYQCRYGTSFTQALKTLLNDGGIARLYRGLAFALVQAPLARFVSTAANDGVESFLASFELTSQWGPGRTTVVASIVVGLWRMFLMRKYENRLASVYVSFHVHSSFAIHSFDLSECSH